MCGSQCASPAFDEFVTTQQRWAYFQAMMSVDLPDISTTNATTAAPQMQGVVAHHLQRHDRQLARGGLEAYFKLDSTLNAGSGLQAGL